MQLHVQALYVHDEQARLVAINDGSGNRAPRFFLGQTNQGHVWRFRNDLPLELCAELTALCQREPLTTAERPIYEMEYGRLLAEHQPIAQIWFGPAYWFAEGVTVAPGPIPITEQNADLLQAELADWLPDVLTQQPFMAMVVNGQAVAVCASVRITEVAHEAGVETLVGYRQQGYGAAVVSAWAEAVVKKGALPIYSTSIENRASQRVATRLGLSQYGSDFHIT